MSPRAQLRPPDEMLQSVVGWLEDLTGKTATGLYVVAGLEVFGAILILRFMPRRAMR